MKKILSLALLILLSFPALCFAESPDHMPDKMLPGSIIIYDKYAHPIIVKGGYVNTENAYNDVVKYENPFQKRIHITTDMSKAERELAEWENALCEKATKNMGNVIYVDNMRIQPNIKVVYNQVTGDIDNILYKNDNAVGGYSLHNPYTETTRLNPIGTFSWGNHNNTLTRQNNGNVLGEGRATVFNDLKGNRDNELKYRDCATQQYYDFSKKGDKNVNVRNLNTDNAMEFYQADVGGLPDAIIDIWGNKALNDLAGGTLTVLYTK